MRRKSWRTEEHSEQEKHTCVKTLTVNCECFTEGSWGTRDIRGNFLAMLDGNHDPVTALGYPKHSSHQIHNEVLDALAQMAHSFIINEVKESETFSPMAEQICFVLLLYKRTCRPPRCCRADRKNYLSKSHLSGCFCHEWRALNAFNVMQCSESWSGSWGHSWVDQSASRSVKNKRKQ